MSRFEYLRGLMPATCKQEGTRRPEMTLPDTLGMRDAFLPTSMLTSVKLSQTESAL